MPAHNVRFGVMAAVTPRKRQWEIERLYPAGRVVEAATTPSRWDVGCKCGTAQCNWEAKKTRIFDNEARLAKPLEQGKN